MSARAREQDYGPRRRHHLTAQAKSETLQRAGIRAATNPSEVAELVAEALDDRS